MLEAPKSQIIEGPRYLAPQPVGTQVSHVKTLYMSAPPLPSMINMKEPQTPDLQLSALLQLSFDDFFKQSDLTKMALNQKSILQICSVLTHCYRTQTQTREFQRTIANQLNELEKFEYLIIGQASEKEDAKKLWITYLDNLKKILSEQILSKEQKKIHAGSVNDRAGSSRSHSEDENHSYGCFSFLRRNTSQKPDDKSR
ncbi:MAG: hypothetical protein PHY80_01845 [Rickettsiales bacterium]|nr:hypothetical protein [Rickettsiales bacterium]